MGEAVLEKQLTSRDRLCFRCPLPECDEDSELCPYQKARAERQPTKSRRWLVEKVRVLKPGEETVLHFETRRERSRSREAIYREFNFGRDEKRIEYSSTDETLGSYGLKVRRVRW